MDAAVAIILLALYLIFALKGKKRTTLKALLGGKDVLAFVPAHVMASVASSVDPHTNKKPTGSNKEKKSDWFTLMTRIDSRWSNHLPSFIYLFIYLFGMGLQPSQTFSMVSSADGYV